MAAELNLLFIRKQMEEMEKHVELYKDQYPLKNYAKWNKNICPLEIWYNLMKTVFSSGTLFSRLTSGATF